MSALFDLSGKIAVVTGGGSGLGRAMAGGLADHGASVTLVGRNEARLATAVAAITNTAGRAHAETCDLLDGEAISQLIAAVEDREGQIDVLVNNAGVQHRGPVTGFVDADWHRVLDTNLTAPFQLSRAVAPGMIARGSGKIINTLSVLSSLGRSSMVPYASAKGGLKMLTRGLAVELAASGIQVNGIALGYILTEMNTALAEDEQFDGWLRGRTPAGRWGAPGDLAGAAVFLASSASDFVTGQVLTVDGGLTASV
ncbi:SDR family oxidoreductase [Allosediminivita pacifica]|uniref:Gluconate 5-dehydrogenase n=1 Tax=Allosediminivita pacifica TaxID=1267769 RepID=A0A2T5ZWC5_9RHOB|nr:SDR family oxidoreductase [Allosediminivita pacifica]PTX35870.1 gluconate 5-dehydrogenase [Allosediminivita pacifica]